MGAEEEGEATSDSSSLTTGSSCCGIGVLWTRWKQEINVLSLVAKNETSHSTVCTIMSNLSKEQKKTKEVVVEEADVTEEE